jgi:hypothetical protein
VVAAPIDHHARRCTFAAIFRSIVGEPLHTCVKRLGLERAIQHILYGVRPDQQAFEWSREPN